MANWPLIAIRLAETILFFAIAFAAVLVILVPILISLGVDLGNIDVESAENFEEFLGAFAGKWLMLVWIFLAVLAVVVLFVAIHSLVEAGSARVYTDGERIAGPSDVGAATRFKVFSMDRWLAGAKDGWWTVFWIYNLAWGLAGMILLIPIVPTAVVTFMFRERNPGVVIGVGCLGLAISLLLMLLVTVFTTMWVNRAITEWAVHRTGASASLGAARRALGGDLGRHILIAIAVFVIGIAGSMFFSSFSVFASIGDIVGRNTSNTFMVTLPLRIIGTILSSAFSAAMSAWFLASYSSLTVETPPSS